MCLAILARSLPGACRVRPRRRILRLTRSIYTTLKLFKVRNLVNINLSSHFYWLVWLCRIFTLSWSIYNLYIVNLVSFNVKRRSLVDSALSYFAFTMEERSFLVIPVPPDPETGLY